MERRCFLAVSAAALLPWSGPVAAQARKRYRIGFVTGSGRAAVKPFEDAFVGGLRDLGYVEGRDFVLDRRYGEGDPSRIPGLVDQVVALNPDVLVGIEAVAQVMQAKTHSVPIVLPSSQDPVAAGLVKSLAEPGTNVTGIANLTYEMTGKHVDLLTELVPSVSRAGLINDAAFAGRERFEQAAKAAAAAKRISMVIVSARDGKDIGPAFDELKREGAQAVAIAATAGTIQVMRDIIDHSLRTRIPAIDGRVQFPEAGGLLSYGPSLAGSFRQAAIFVDRIFRGAKPQNLPVQQPTKFQLVINARTAKKLGIAVPAPLLIMADRIIQ